MNARSGADVPGAFLVGIWPLVAAAVIAFNVFYLRRAHPGVVSGKLSDLGINFLLPVLLAAALEWVTWMANLVFGLRTDRLAARIVVVACLISAGYFTLLKTLPAFTEVHRRLLTSMTAPWGSARRFRNIADPTDLVTLVTTPLAARYLRRHRSATPLFARSGTGPSDSARRPRA